MVRRAVIAGLGTFVLALALPVASWASSLTYHGGPVLHSSAPYLVFWTPSGEGIPAASQALMERYLTDVAADSGKASNVFGVLRQYHDRAGFADYRQTFVPTRQVIVDTHPYPPHDTAQCQDVSRFYPTCIADPQIQAELQRLITADHLPTAGSWRATMLHTNAPVYLVILPADVQVCYVFGTLCTGNQITAYHLNFVDRGGDVVLYAPLPLQPMRAGSVLFPDPKGVFQIDGTSVVQTPNGDVNTDVLIDSLSHEDSETITDPLVTADHSGWFDTGTKDEVGDKCEMYTSAKLGPGLGNNPNAFLPTLGGSEPAGTLYTQLINGHPYYTQSEWSNGDYGCEMRPSPGRMAARFAVPRGANKAGASLTFSPTASTSKNALSSATWNFGDGSLTGFYYGKAALSRATHRYRRAGRYTVTLTLVDNRGNLQTTTRRVRIHAR